MFKDQVAYSRSISLILTLLVDLHYQFSVARVDRRLVGSVDLTHPALRAPLLGGDFHAMLFRLRLVLSPSPVLPNLAELLDGNLASAYSGVQIRTSDLGDKIQTSTLMIRLEQFRYDILILRDVGGDDRHTAIDPSLKSTVDYIFGHAPIPE